MACLDTTTLIDLCGRGGKRLQKRAQDKVKQLRSAQEALTTTIFNLAELWVGVERSDDQAKEQTVVEGILLPLRVLDFDRAAAMTFGRITAHAQRAGLPVGDMDALIASVALLNGETVVTRNERHFSSIPGLRIESY